MKKITLLVILLYIINLVLVLLIDEDINKLISILFISIIYAALYICIIKIYRKTKRADNILFFAFIIIITMQGLIFFNYKNTVSSIENRVLASLPEVNLFHENFAEEMDAYINDRIGLRNEAVKIYGIIPYIKDYNIQDKVIKGINGWLYLNDGDSYLYYQGVKNYTDEKLEQIKSNIKSNMEFCEKNNIKLITIIPPDKTTVYPEYYNPYIKKLPGKTNYEILKEFIENTFPNKNIILPYNEIINAKQDKVIYFSKDSHWNSYGAYSGYKVLAEDIAEVFPAYKIISEKDIIKCDRSEYTYNDLEKMLGIKNITKDNSTDICPKEKNILDLKYENAHKTIWWQKSYGSKDAPKILLVHDSFMVELAPFIEKGALAIGSIWTYDKDFNKISDMILSFKPDLIIWERVERLWAD